MTPEEIFALLQVIARLQLTVNTQEAEISQLRAEVTRLRSLAGEKDDAARTES